MLKSVFRPFLMVPALLLLGAPAFSQQSSTPQTTPPAAGAAAQEYKIPPEWVSRANPVTPTPALEARAKQIYSWDCAVCHGTNGDGRGDVAVEQKLDMKDFRDPASLRSLTDGEMFYIIRHGKGKMPAEDQRAKDNELWALIIYLRHMSEQPAAAPSAPAPAQQ